MKTSRFSQVTGALLITTFSAHLSSSFGQGTLTPPGPPAASMLTLSQVEPRTPVDAVHTPANNFAEFAISNSGSYYLTTNVVITTAGFNAIYITTNNVTLDLNGFSLLAASGAGYGINILSGCTNICVQNGLISGWSEYGISCAGANVILDRLTVSANAGGIALTGPGRCIVRNSIVSGNTASGILCSANNATFQNLMVSSNNPGLFLSGVASGVIKDCTANENLTAGIECVSSTNMTLQDLTSSHNNGYGLLLNGFQNGAVNDCKVDGNGVDTGIYLVGSSCFILGNSCSGNGISIFMQGANNQIDGNHVIGSNPSSVGIWINSGTNNIVVRNFVTGYGANDYSLPAGQIAGPIVSSSSSGTITNSNPWANFAF